MDNKFKKKLEKELDKLNGDLTKLNEKKEEIEENIREKTEHKKYVMNKLANINRMEKQLMKLEEDFNNEYKKEKIIDEKSDENDSHIFSEDDTEQSIFEEKNENVHNEYEDGFSDSYDSEGFDYASNDEQNY